MAPNHVDDPALTSGTIRFGKFEVDRQAGQLLKRGIRIPLREQSFQILALLLERPGQVVTRDELRQRLWRDEVFVEFDKSLNTAVAHLREALGDRPEHPLYVETLPRRGYRFIGEVCSASREAPDLPQRAKLLVLPFVNLSGQAAEEHFSDAITDEVITAFASLASRKLAVIARTTAMHYKGSRKDVAGIGRELGVDYVVEGGVRRSQDRVSVNVQLIQVGDQTHLFAKRYEHDLLDMFHIQDCLAREVGSHLPGFAAKLGATPIAPKRRPTLDVVAYNAYMRGRSYIHQWTPEAMASARQCFQEAIARDPEFALAHASLAELYAWLGWLGFMNPKDAFACGVWAALRALELDDSLPHPHACLGLFRKEHDCDWAEVRRRTTRALELDPSSPEMKFWYAGAYLLPLGRIDEAVTEIESALEMDPLSVFLRCWLALMLDFGRHYDRGLNEARLAMELDHDSYIPHFTMGHLFRDKGMYSESIAAHRTAVERSGNAPLMMGWLGLSLALSGNTCEAHRMLEMLNELAAATYVPPSSFAWIHVGLGELQDAFGWMERSIEAHDPMMTPIKTYPFLDPVRSDPRFAMLLRKMNLEG